MKRIIGYLVIVLVLSSIVGGCTQSAPTSAPASPSESSESSGPSGPTMPSGTEAAERKAPAAFSVSALTISLTEVDIGEEVTISILATNTGDLLGMYEVTLKIDTVTVTTKDIPLSRGGTKLVAFRIVKDVAGTYTIDVNGLTGTLTVKTAPDGGTEQ